MWSEITLGIAVVFLFFWTLSRKPAGLPPGRWGLPFIGYIPFSKKPFDDFLHDFQNEFGDVYVWRIGTQVLLFVHDYHIVRQIFASQDFTDRPNWSILMANQETALGVAFSNDKIWQTNRQFCLRQLRDLGMGKSGLSEAVQTQAIKLVEALKDISGKPQPITPALNTAVVNVIWKLVANRQFEKDDPQLLEFQKLVEEFTQSVGPLIIRDIFPWLKTILPRYLMHKLCKQKIYDLVVAKFFSYFDEVIKEHKASLDSNDPKDLMDGYLIEMNESNGNYGLRNEKDLLVLTLDMFLGGTDTTTNTLKWILLYLASYPDVQRKVQQEIDEALSEGAPVTLEYKPKLQYTEAVINEIMRKASLASVGLQHVASQDTQIAGYTIPKGTIVMASIASIHHDSRYWDKPEKFHPERWLNSEGKFVMKKEGYLPFGVGKRNCIGESLARMELVIITVTVLQSFNISPPSGKMVDLTPDCNNPLGHEPQKQDIVFTLRTN